ncbi:MAG: vanadium-dependent haloperoxidase, partial [Gaiellaceae bacterium]
MATTIAAGKPQAESQLYVGFAQAAVYDAVVAVEGGYEPHLIVPGVPPGSSAEAAAAAAAYGVLVSYFPAQKPMLDAAYAASLDAIPDGPAEDRGVLVGQQVATGLVAARIDDGRDAPVPFDPPLAPGAWRPTPPGFLPALHPWLGVMKPFVLERASQFRPGPPPALGSNRYARDFEETKRYGALVGSLRTPEQTETGLFWTEHAPQQYNRAVRGFVTSRGLNLRDAARALVLADAVMADAFIACWDAKNTYAFWRPVTAIPEADTDGNERTTPDPGWQPLQPTPSHPEYPSAHNCLAGALAEALSDVAGS